MSALAPLAPWANRIVDHGEEPPESLLPNPANWRLHGAAQRGALADVLGEVGLVQSVIVNRTSGHLIDGHLRVELAIAKGQPAVPVVYVDLSEEEERIILASLDPIGAMADADRDRLSELLGAIENEDLAELLDAVARANRIALDLGNAGLTDPDEVPEPPQEPVSKPGDLWTLGKHRLLCGDSTNADDVQRLMAGKRASLMATDPPYLVDYDGGNHPPTVANGGLAPTVADTWAPGMGNKSKWKADPDAGTKHWDAYIDQDHSVAFYVEFLRAAVENALAKEAAIYQCFGAMRSEVLFAAWRTAGLLPHQMLVWHKSRAVLTHCDYLWDYEPLMYGWVQGSRPPSSLRPPANTQAVWEIASGGDEEGVAGTHPTIKPVELIRRPILYHTHPGGLIYEPFSGSGTALIAAEDTGRVCYAIEQSPAFVDVAVARWEAFTGKKATLAKAKQGGPNG
jgi:DNA modification methylase